MVSHVLNRAKIITMAKFYIFDFTRKGDQMYDSLTAAEKSHYDLYLGN